MMASQSPQHSACGTAHCVSRRIVLLNPEYGFPTSAVAIGSNGSGDQLIFIPSPTNSQVLESAVYWWSHETGELEKIAEDFSELG